MEKGLELAKLARSDGQEFDCATWLHNAGSSLPKGQFKREQKITGRATEPWENIYFKLHKSQNPVIEQAMETADLMLSLRSRLERVKFHLRGLQLNHNIGQRLAITF